MRIKELEIKNFLSIGYIKFNLDQPGLNLVLGKNLDSKQFDSNGAAKSSVFEALIWCLYGEFVRKISISEAVRRGTTGMEVKVSLDPEDGSPEVIITRTRKTKKSSIEIVNKEGTQLFPANSYTDIQPSLDNFLGLDFNTFVNSVYFGKGLAKFFMSFDDSERRNLLESILQLMDFDEVYAKAKNKVRTTENEIIRIGGELDYLKRGIFECGSSITELDSKISVLKTNQELVENEYKEKKEDLVHKLNKDKQLLSGANKNNKELEDCQKETFSALDKEYKEKVKDIEDEAKEEEQELIKLLKSSKETILSRESELTKLESNYVFLSGIEKEILNEKQKLLLSKSELTGKMVGWQNKLSAVVNLTKDSRCPVCFGALTEEHTTEARDYILNVLILPLSEEIEKIDFNISSLEINELAPCVQKKEDAYLQYNKLKDELKGELSNIEKLYSADKLELEKHKNKLITEIRDEYSSKRQEYQDGFLKRFKEISEGIRKYTENISSFTGEIMKLDIAVASSGKELEIVLSNKKSKEELVAKYTTSQNEQEDLLNKLKEELPLQQFWEEAFSPKGIRSFIFENALPFLNDRANYYSSLVTGGTVTINILPTTTVKSTGAEKEKLTVSAVNKHGADIYAGNSDGEKRRIDICILLALQDLISTRANKQWNILILDELIDSLDNTGIDVIISILRDRDINKSVYIISHNNDLKGYFDSYIEVEKKNGVSSLSNL